VFSNICINLVPTSPLIFSPTPQVSYMAQIGFLAKNAPRFEQVVNPKDARHAAKVRKLAAVMACPVAFGLPRDNSSTACHGVGIACPLTCLTWTCCMHCHPSRRWPTCHIWRPRWHPP
jgi:hypothetical protein